MVPAMFGMGGTEILVILVVALLFLGPDKLPEAAKQISKGIRDIKRQSRALQQTIEDDEHIGGAIRDLKSALRGEDAPVRTPKLPDAAAAVSLPVLAAAPEHAELTAGTAVEDAANQAMEPATEPAPTESIAGSSTAADRPMLTLPPTVGERDADEPDASSAHDDAAELAALVRPAPNTIPRGAAQPAQPSASAAADTAGPPETPETSERKHG